MSDMAVILTGPSPSSPHPVVLITGAGPALDTRHVFPVPVVFQSHSGDAGIVFKTNFQTISVADNYNDVCLAMVVVVGLSNDSPDNSSHHSLWVGIFVDHQQDGPDKYKYYMEAQHSEL